jgi:apolipoprotein N-acyltransferase
VYAICAIKKRALIAFSCILFALFLCPEEYILPPDSPADFYSVNTSFGLLGSGSYDYKSDYERFTMIFSYLAKEKISSMAHENILLPETIAGKANNISLELWKDEINRLARPSQTVIWGAEVPTHGGDKYDNCLLLYDGKNIISVAQRIPVPYSMYRGPFSDVGANLHYLDDGILPLPDGRRAAVLICYEAFLTWPVLRSFWESPDILVSASNLWWCKDTSIPASYSRILALWGRLFGVRVVYAVNR